MKQRIINAALLVAISICYLEWGTNQKYFMFQMEYEFFSQIIDKADSFTHPLILFPFIGQVILLVTLFQKQPSRWLSITGLITTAVLVIMIALSGILSLNLKMMASVLPYFVLAVLSIINLRKKKSTPQA